MMGIDPTVYLGAQQLAGTDGSGVSWDVQTLTGWYDSAAPTLRVAQREADHGGWGGGSWLTPRVLMLGVHLSAATPDAIVSALDVLGAAASLDASPLRLVEASGLDRTIQVRRNGEVLTTWDGIGGTAVAVSIPLIAADPRKYGTLPYSSSTMPPSSSGGLILPATLPAAFDAVVDSGQISCGNAGTIGSRPLLRITGPCTTPQVTLQLPDGSVQQLIYQGSLLAGEYLDLDCDAHTATADGTASRRGLITGTWLELPPGSSAGCSAAFRVDTSGAGCQLTMTWYDAWM
jgi:hypothetical protein